MYRLPTNAYVARDERLINARIQSTINCPSLLAAAMFGCWDSADKSDVAIGDVGVFALGNDGKTVRCLSFGGFDC